MIKNGPTLILFVAMIGSASTAPIEAQVEAEATASSTTLRFLHDFNKKHLLSAVAMLGEDDFSFRATPEVRTVAEIFGHIADVQYRLCSAGKGEVDPRAAAEATLERSVRAKEEVLAALTASFDYCDPVYAGLRDGDLARSIEVGPMAGRSVADALAVNVYHAGQHYGHLTVYLRLKGLVPPSSQSSGGRERGPE